MPPSFKGYSADYAQLGPELERLEWKSLAGGYIFVRDGRFLSVCGDFGGAVYAFASARDLEFVSRCAPDFLAERAEAFPFSATAYFTAAAHLSALQSAFAQMSGVEPEGVEHG